MYLQGFSNDIHTGIVIQPGVMFMPDPEMFEDTYTIYAPTLGTLGIKRNWECLATKFSFFQLKLMKFLTSDVVWNLSQP